VRACAQCHGGPGQSTPQATPNVPPAPVVRFHSILSQCPRPVDTATPARFAFAACAPRLARNARIYEIELSVATATPGGVLPVGAKVRRTSSDPGRALLTGFVGGPAPQDDWDKFDVPALRGISKTAPYFHNNSAATLEEMVDHYIEFFKRVKANWVPGTPIPPIATTDGVNFDRAPTVAEREALIAYLRKL
jgi:cytochrome c peroxidase